MPFNPELYYVWRDLYISINFSESSIGVCRYTDLISYEDTSDPLEVAIFNAVYVEIGLITGA